MRKTSLILVLALILTLVAVPVWAAPNASAIDRENPVQNGTQSMTMLQDGTSYIADAGGSTLYISCQTYAYYSVPEIGLEINVQRWNGSSWVTIQTIPFYNTYSNYIGKNITVPAMSGYSYRLVTKHYCENGANYEYLYTTTNGITVY
ncbi:MAG: hypothetical protein GX434_03345 [Peptococcaceae bacterium]|nr:hypothetical protein [Peptococcaceae bacterium]